MVFFKHYPQYSKIFFGLLQVRWRNICLPCQMADIFNKQTTYKVYENCLDLDVLLRVKENPHLQLINLLEKHDHFLCKIINEKYQYYHKCFFTGKHIYLDIERAYLEWEKTKIDKIVCNQPSVFLENYFKENKFFKVE